MVNHSKRDIVSVALIRNILCRQYKLVFHYTKYGGTDLQVCASIQEHFCICNEVHFVKRFKNTAYLHKERVISIIY